MEPGEGALDDPAVAAEAGTVFGLAARDHRFDPALPDQPPILVVVVAAVSDQAVGPAARPPNRAADCGHPVQQGYQLGDVVAVAAGKRERERDPSRVDEEMVLGAGTASVDWARARSGAPLFRLHLTGVGDRARPLELTRRP